MPGLIDTLKSFVNKEPPPKRGPQDYIPPGADISGIGPNFIDDSEKAPITNAGDPYAPQMGNQQPTHQHVIDQSSYGDPAPDPTYTERYWRKIDTDDRQRHSVQERDSNGWETPVVYRTSFVPATREPPNRITAYAHYELDSQVQTVGRTGMQPYNLNGNHFSLADHRRDYEIYGQVPVKRSRNTYRVEPTPWDLNIRDVPARDGIPVQAETEVPASTVSSYMGNRSYRLGG